MRAGPRGDRGGPTTGGDLTSVALLLLRPDALASGDGQSILEDVEARHAAKPVALRVRTVEPFLVDAMYRRQTRIPRESLWLHHEVYASGPSAAVLLTRQRPGLMAELYAAKGPSAVLDSAAADSLRTRFARAGSFHAVVHAPRDEDELVEQAALFFDPATVAGAARAPHLPAAWVRDLLELEPRPGRLVFQAAVKVKRRIAAAAGLRLGAGVVGELRERTAAADRDLDGAGYLSQREHFRAFADQERPLLAAALDTAHGRVATRAAATGGRAAQWRTLRDAAAPVALLSCSWFLSGHEPWSEDGGARLFAALSEHDVPLEASARTLLSGGLREDLP